VPGNNSVNGSATAGPPTTLTDKSSRHRTAYDRAQMPTPSRGAATGTGTQTSCRLVRADANVRVPAAAMGLIRLAETPRRAADLGRDPSAPLRPDWEQVRDDVMRRAVRAKFRTHADIREILLATGDQEIIEDSPTDHYWGQGSTGAGKNTLGRILMEARTQLRTEVADSGI